jgi:hypothetical protein
MLFSSFVFFKPFITLLCLFLLWHFPFSILNYFCPVSFLVCFFLYIFKHIQLMYLLFFNTFLFSSSVFLCYFRRCLVILCLSTSLGFVRHFILVFFHSCFSPLFSSLTFFLLLTPGKKAAALPRAKLCQWENCLAYLVRGLLGSDLRFGLQHL